MKKKKKKLSEHTSSLGQKMGNNTMGEKEGWKKKCVFPSAHKLKITLEESGRDQSNKS